MTAKDDMSCASVIALCQSHEDVTLSSDRRRHWLHHGEKRDLRPAPKEPRMREPSLLRRVSEERRLSRN